MSIPELYARYRDFDLLVDSRQLTRPKATLFFALPGRRVDGHDFVATLIQQGVQHFVVHKEWEELPQVQSKYSAAKRIELISVQNVLATLQALSAHHRQQFDIPIIGITGSNGKTIVKDWLASLLSRKYRVCASPRSYNSQIGLPLSVWQLRPDHELGIFEAGISQAGEMTKLANILQPTAGIFTNLGEAHRAGFTSDEHKLSEKMLLFRGAQWVLYPDRNKRIGTAIHQFTTAQAIGWRRMEVVNAAKGETNIGYLAPNKPQEEVLTLAIPPLPIVFQDNAIMAAVAGSLLGLSATDVRVGTSDFRPLHHRLEVRPGKQGCTIINDTYSNDLTSLAAALQFAEMQATGLPITLILSDLLETGAPSEKVYPEIAQLLNGKIHRFIGIGSKVTMLAGLLPYNVSTQFYPDRTALIKALQQIPFSNEVILLKGARSFGLERITNYLTKRRHRTQLEIDLTALAHNLSVYRGLLRSGVKMAVMVKAAAYGSGSIPVARLLVNEEVDYLVVAYVDEGVVLREAGIKTPIMVLNTDAAELGLLTEFSLEPVVGDISFLNALEDYAGNEPLTIHLEFDTGMRRLGLAVEDVEQIGRRLLNAPHLQLQSVFTHLAAGEAKEHDPYTHAQVRQFNGIRSSLAAIGLHAKFHHVLNSNGISRFPDYQFDMVRLGIGFYGLGDAQLASQLRPALRLTAQLNNIQQLPAGATVGYGRKGVLTRSSRIGVLSIGYADGLPRLAGQGRYSVLVARKRAPILGAVCMDMTMVDLTDIPAAQNGDEVVIFGPEHPIEALAEVAQTIPYEILTGIGRRVHRVYLEG
ncbi:MAG: bifunctional UDP-N-acetylmuramoyl-tripeptide:D-alanyl-D-alanine ligase/alanine racemase [Bacteroidota bacterium]